MRFLIHKILFLILLVSTLFTVRIYSKDILPKPNSAVADRIGLLSLQQQDNLRNKLKTFNDTSSSAIVLVIDNSTEGDDIFDYSYKLAKSWGIGDASKDNGVLVYIAFNDRKVFIQVGSGLEGVIPDAMAKRIVNNIIVPSFRSGNYYSGINSALDALIQLASGEYTSDGVDDSLDGGTVILIMFLVFFALLIIFSISYYRCKKRGDCNDDGGGYYGGGRYNTGGRRGGWIIVEDPVVLEVEEVSVEAVLVVRRWRLQWRWSRRRMVVLNFFFTLFFSIFGYWCSVSNVGNPVEY
ncbi:MAG: TPM domain-containing protein [Saprospiraceae bacterium]